MNACVVSRAKTRWRAMLLSWALAMLAPPAASGQWTMRAPMDVPRQEIGVAALGEVLYAVGGFDADGQASDVLEAYDTSTDRWSRLAPLPVRVHHPGAAAVDGRLYVIGGLAANGASVDTVFAYDPASDAWQPRSALPTRRGAMGVAVVDDRIYAAGGLLDGVSVADFAVYDPMGDAWTPLPAMPTARDHLAAGAIGGTFYAVGGRASGTLFARIEAFDPADGAWREGLAPMPTARGGLAAAALDGRLFAFGGEGNAAHTLGVFPETESYDPVADRWERHAPMPVPRHGTVAVAIGGNIHVPGGASRQGFGTSPAHEVFTPLSGSAFRVARVRLLGTRLVLRGRIIQGLTDPTMAPLTLRVLDGTREVVSYVLPAGSLVAHGSGRRLAYRDANAALSRVIVVRRRGTFGVRIAAHVPRPEEIPAEATLTLELGTDLYSGQARVRRPR
jgi:N-acetylneuraminic acid mutarotase